MQHLKSINEFWSLFKKKSDKTIKVDDTGWVSFSERRPSSDDLLQSANSYRINENGERFTDEPGDAFYLNGNDKFMDEVVAKQMEVIHYVPHW